MTRCCSPDPRDFEQSYASVLVAGLDLRSAVEDMEGLGPLCPCVTAWCGKCRRVSTVVRCRADFPVPSAFFAHALASRAALEAVFARK